MSVSGFSSIFSAEEVSLGIKRRTDEIILLYSRLFYSVFSFGERTSEKERRLFTFINKMNYVMVCCCRRRHHQHRCLCRYLCSEKQSLSCHQWKLMRSRYIFICIQFISHRIRIWISIGIDQENQISFSHFSFCLHDFIIWGVRTESPNSETTREQKREWKTIWCTHTLKDIRFKSVHLEDIPILSGCHWCLK